MSPRPEPFPPTRRRPAARVASTSALLALAALAAAPGEAANHDVAVRDFFFAPQVITIQAGDTITWTHLGGLAHNVRADDLSFRCANGCDNQGGNGNPALGWSFTRAFPTAGEIGYHCQLHGNVSGGGAMTGRIVVQGGGSAPGALRFANGTFSAGEGAGSATITVQRTGGDDGAVSVQAATGGGSATAGGDYTSVTTTLSWPDGDDDPRTFSVPILEDSADEPNESVGLSLSSPAGGATLGTPASANLTITDNDASGPGPAAGNLRFAVASQSVPEEGGPVVVAVQRVEGTAGAVSVQYASAGGTADSGADFTPVSGTLSWGAGDGADKSFQVPVLDDGDTEDDESLSLALSSPGGGAGLGSPSTRTLTLLDDDFVVPGPCVADGTTLCLLDGRFRVQATFTPPGPDGVAQPANALPFTDRAGMFWFFNPNNVEMLVKLQNACVAPFDRFWFFLAATTNVGFEVTVTDTEATRARRYRNPQGTVALPVADTQAFATCP